MWADFNAVDADHRITASLCFADTAERPSPGEWVHLYDDDGNSVRGVVEEVEDLAVRVRPSMETWVTTLLSIDAPFANRAPFLAQATDPGEMTRR